MDSTARGCVPHPPVRASRWIHRLLWPVVLLGTTVPAQQPAQWTTRFLGQRAYHALAYDVARQRTVLFGGRVKNGAFAETWEWDGATWSQRTPLGNPGARSGHAVAYDAGRRRVVLFGGSTETNSLLADTWEWDGNTWSQRTPLNVPSARTGHAMAYDVARQRIVLFGGSDASRCLADTMEWDGANWTLATPAISPRSRAFHALAYDLARQRVVLFGGSDAGTTGPTYLQDTWEWDGIAWTGGNTASGPSGRAYHSMAYDVKLQRTVLFGGGSFIPPFMRFYLQDVWVWDGSTWQSAAQGKPGPRWGAAMAYDVARSRVVLFGGEPGQPYYADTWEWDGGNSTSWTERSMPAAPSPREGHAMAYDIVRERVVLCGGAATAAETWDWDGWAWTARLPLTRPSSLGGHAMAYDLARRRIVLFGGGDANGPLAETWLWDGTTWTKAAPATSPSARMELAMAYDAARQRVVLYGGRNGGNSLADLWEWDGTNWTRSPPVRMPPARYGHAMAYDVARACVVLYGGVVAGTGYDISTWEWDGVQWNQRTSNSYPGYPHHHAIAYDLQRQRVVLFGGAGQGTWEWNGLDWQASSSATRPCLRSSSAIAYDIARRNIVLFGGFGPLGDTWLYGNAVRAETQTFGMGCAGSRLPLLSSNLPRLGNAAFGLEVIGARAASACLFGLAANSQALPIPPCTLYVQGPIVTLPALTNAFGWAGTTHVTIPPEIALRGTLLYAQAFVADPQGPALGLAFSAGLKLVIGD